MIRKSNVFNIEAGLPFLDTLAAGILERYASKPESLIKITILLPTRRACRSLSMAFLRLTSGKPMLLPKMIPLGDIDEDELVLSGIDELAEEASFEIAPAIPYLHRQLLLTRMIMARKDNDTTTDQAARLAQELARLLDQVQTEQLSFDKLNTLVENEDLSKYWQKTIEFLSIISQHWPKVLAEKEVLDPAERRNRLLNAQNRLWQQNPPYSTVIAAGSTGSIPATANLLKTISQMANGLVVLPGLDKDSDELVWQALEPSHPQYGLAHLIEHLQIKRSDVSNWRSSIKTIVPVSRATLINQALMPASVTDRWQARTKLDPNALLGVTLIEANNEKEEAGMIALALRKTLETDGKTAALVTPDRALSRRVTAELARWNIDIDDSAGYPLIKTPPGTFVRQCARVIADGVTPIALLGLLKHPYAAGGMNPIKFRKLVRRLEVTLRLGPRPGQGCAALKAAIKKADHKKIYGLEQLIDGLDKIISPFSLMFDLPQVPLKDLLESHVQLAEALATTDKKNAGARLWGGKDGEALALFFAELNEASDSLRTINAKHYPALIDALLSPRVHRPTYGRHPRLHIWGLLEARLQKVDLMILGSLNENSWPPEVPASPWMSRPMLDKFGLSQPERRLGLTAHDFSQAASAKEVILSRAARSGGSPTVPSRWLQRIKTLLSGKPLVSQLQPDPELSAVFARLDRPEEYLDPTEPLPTPPLVSRPRKLSVSRIETWIRDPYSIYARHILKLKVLEPIDAEQGAAHRGVLVHDALDRFIKKYPDDLPGDAYENLIKIGTQVFDEQMHNAAMRAFWWPRFERIAQWFVDNEILQRHAGRIPLSTETSGEITFAAPGGDFILNARADRVDRTPDGTLAIIDYKTGGVPTKNQIKSGLTPQLTLEAAIAARGKFNGVDATSISKLIYMKLSGAMPAGEESGVFEDVEILAADALQGLKKLVADFDDEETPYLSRPVPQFLSRFGDYDHLARVKEWMAGDDSEVNDH
jgi:ATP-dependent helicase/nuclease subunit B